MIRHFQRKFIVVSTCALVLVLVTIIGSITSIAFYRSQNEVNTVLTMLIQNDGQLPSKNIQQPTNGFLGSRFSREGLYQYRYFSAELPTNHDPIKINSQHILTVSPKAIQQLAKQVIKRSSNHGTVRYQGIRYAYQIKRRSQATQVVFLDETLLMSETREILHVSIMLGLICLILYTVILIAFSKRAIKPIIEAEQRQREFITNAGHELKTPLTVISANTEMQELTTGEDEWTKSNQEQVTRLTKLINNLISLARLEEQPTFEITALNASKIVQQVAESFKSVTMKDGHQLQIHVQSGLMIQGEMTRFEELINILLDNANKYCDPNGTIKLRLRKSKRAKDVTLTVANSYAHGQNINYRKFFDRFYRADTAHHITQQSGFGIGLSMAQRIVTLFHGKIKAQYQNGMISFQITLRSAN
ncbi:HAMP domain-containing sensor histidine kinase [uncultured Limosilactobacillus sp.]|uniref:sensor histidine kinase n=1 Tax=uncultured Limosilactobacillus sp. TaxID=2837629 RepID=UPI0025D94CB9|nr:HAMP domain-containing sensor histidine kinase [uncultured Limosilactobacillus sp.]